MNLTFLGHQGWMLSSGNANFLIDPILLESFGLSKNGPKFKIYPTRKVNQLPKISGIFLSHEHPDHVDLDGLLSLDQKPIVYVGQFMPIDLEREIARLGFPTVRLSHNQLYSIDDLKIILFSPCPTTPLWEARCSQMYFHTSEASVFMAIDAPVSPLFIEGVKNGEIKIPSALIIPNNAQLVDDQGTHANRDLRAGNDHRFGSLKPGINILNFLSSGMTHGLEIPHLMISGGGFCDNPNGYLFSNPKEIASLLNQLSVSHRFHGFDPGEGVTLPSGNHYSSTVVQITNEKQLWKNIPTNIPELMTRSDDLLSESVLLVFLENQLQFFYNSLASSQTGHLFFRSERRGNLSFCLEIILPTRSVRYRPNFIKGRFEVHEIDPLSFSTGLRINALDFYNLLLGRCLIWDLLGTGIQTWYENYETSIFNFLFCYFSEIGNFKIYSSLRESSFSGQSHLKIDSAKFLKSTPTIQKPS